MKPQRWRERLLASTRGQILALLRTDVRTVNELAAVLKLTDNAVRAHLVSLERDGLIQRQGSRRGIRKPHISYGLSADAEQIFPKAYGSLLNYLVASISRRLDRRELRASMREVGLSLANEHAGGLSKKSRKERLATALDLLKKLGGEATYHADGKKFIRSNHCPIAAITAHYPDACLIVETFLSKVIGARVKQHCERGVLPRCCFELATKK
jgi:predicted ArsR family transcriptional regulator